MKIKDAYQAILIAIFLIPTIGLKAQDLRFRHYSVEDGLSQSVVFDLMQARDGFLWLATQDGLNRFDGYEFEVFSNDPADSTTLSSNWISSLFEDEQGRLWVGTHGGGLNLLNRETGQFQSFRADPNDASSLPDDVVTDIVQDGSGEIWVSTYGGLARLNEEGDAFVVYRVDPERGAWLSTNRVLTLGVDVTGRLWVGTDLGGVYAYNEEENTFSAMALPGGVGDTSKDVILSLYSDPQGAMWVGTGGAGLFKLDLDGNVDGQWRASGPAPIPADRILAIARDTEGRLRVGTDGAGMGIVQEKEGHYLLHSNDPGNVQSLSGNTVNTIMTDRAGFLWLGTSGGGVNREYALELISADSQPAISRNDVRALYEAEDGSIWVGTDSGGLDHINIDGSVTSVRAPQLTHNAILKLDAGTNSTLWVSTAGGLNKLDLETGRIQSWYGNVNDPSALFDGRVFGVSLSKEESKVWVASWGGLHQLDLTTGRFTQFRHDASDETSLSNNRSISVLEDRRGRVWVGTLTGGLNRMDPGVPGFVRFTPNPLDDTSLSGDIVASIFEASDSTIWIGTTSGLNRYEENTSSFTRYTEATGLPNNTIYGILEDDQFNLWMSTNLGLAVLNPRTGAVRSFTTADGLQSNEFNQGAFHRAPTGELLFGGINGFNRFRPEQLLALGGERPELTAVSTSEMIWPVTGLTNLDEIVLRPGFGSLNIEFTSMDWRNPDENSFEFKMEGVDEEWQERTARQRFASWSLLPGGTHLLRIRTRGSGGAQASVERVLTVRVIPPLTDRLWFRLLIAMAILGTLSGAGYSWHVSRLAQIEKKQREQQEIHQRLMDSREHERLHMAQDLHDGAVQDLYGIRFKIQSGNEPDADAMVQDVITQLRQICGELRPPVLAPFGLKKAIKAHADSFAEREGVPTVHLSLDNDGQTIPEDVRLALYRVYQESMNNLLKHAEANQVTVVLSVNNASVELSIEDDGKGFSLPASWIELGRKDHFGLLGLSERVTALGAQLNVRTSPGSGTRIHVLVEDVNRASSLQP